MALYKKRHSRKTRNTYKPGNIGLTISLFQEMDRRIEIEEKPAGDKDRQAQRIMLLSCASSSECTDDLCTLDFPGAS